MRIRRIKSGLLLVLSCAVTAHEIPTDVTVQAFVKPRGERLSLLVRVPLKAMRDIEFPQRGPGHLDAERFEAELRNAASLWIAGAIDLYEQDEILTKPRIVASRVSGPSDRSFASYEKALAHLSGPQPPLEAGVYWDQAALDVSLEYPIRAANSRFSIRPRLAHLGLRVVTALRFLPPAGSERVFEFHGDPGLVRLDPRWHQAALRFTGLGFLHILEGIDHLLFLLCLVIPFRQFRSLIPVVTAFTVAHSITLIGSAYDLAPGALWFPPLIETLIAISIVYMAFENIFGAGTGQRRWTIAFGFGLVHGFGFSFALKETLQLAGSHLLTSLLSFNLGVELGQILVLALLIPLLQVFFRLVTQERIGTIVLSALVAHTGWHWTLDRADRLRQYPLQWPELTSAWIATALRWGVLLVAAAALFWLAPAARRLMRRNAETQAKPL